MSENRYQFLEISNDGSNLVQSISQEEINEMNQDEHENFNGHSLFGGENILFEVDYNKEYKYPPLVERSGTHKVFQFGDEPELIHFVKAGFKNMWFWFFEDGHESEPWLTGVHMSNTQELNERFNVNLVY